METPMRIRLFFTSMLAALMSFTVQAYAGKFVEFESGAGKSNPTRIIGYLARPQGSGPFPAVVVLHGCGGFQRTCLHGRTGSAGGDTSPSPWTVLVLAELRPRAVALVISPQTRSRHSHT